MPPKPKFARREIVEAALDLVSRRGPEALTARNLGERLGSSARPIFTVFQGMDELRQEVRAAAMARFASYADRAPADVPEFKRAGVQMLLFAQEEPRLYQLLFVNGSREAASFPAAVHEEQPGSCQLCRCLRGAGAHGGALRGGHPPGLRPQRRGCAAAF